MSKDEVLRGLRMMVGSHQEKPELRQDYDYKMEKQVYLQQHIGKGKNYST